MLTLLHDVVSCASLVAVLRLQRLADEGADVAFVGLDLRGFDVTLPATLDVLEEYDRHARTARELGVEPRRPRTLPPTVAVHAVEELADTRGLASAWRLAAYRAYWEEGRDLADHAVLTTLAGEVGLPVPDVRDVITDSARLAALRRGWQVWRGRGVGGVPVLVADGGTLLSPEQSDDDLRTLAAL